jgi:hypothetical protein
MHMEMHCLCPSSWSNRHNSTNILNTTPIQAAPAEASLSFVGPTQAKSGTCSKWALASSFGDIQGASVYNHSIIGRCIDRATFSNRRSIWLLSGRCPVLSVPGYRLSWPRVLVVHLIPFRQMTTYSSLLKFTTASFHISSSSNIRRCVMRDTDSIVKWTANNKHNGIFELICDVDVTL